MIRALSAFASAVFLTACAPLQPMPSGAPEAGGFELSGRVAVRYGEEASTAGVQWRHSDAGDDLLITNPLGQGVARITRSDETFELKTSEGQEYRASDPESLTAQALGWSLPLRGLPQWVRGRAVEGDPADIVRDAEQRVTEMRQDDWHIVYDAYAGARPTRLTLSRPDLRIRLLIDSWQTGTP